MKKNEEFIGKCIDYDKDGNGIVKHDGFVYFVKGLIKDEVAKIKVISLKKNYGYGRIVDILEISENRVKPVCSVYKHCGGCNLQHMSFLEQANFKKSVVENTFRNIANLDVEVNDVLSMEDPYRYRNKVQVPVQYDEDLKIGFYRSFSNVIVEFDDCVVQSKLSNNIIDYFRNELVKYEFKDLIRHVLIKHSHNLNEVMVVIVCREVITVEINEFVENLYNKFDEIKSIVLNVNKREDNVILGEEEYLLKGKDFIQEEICGYKFNISSKSFFQINPYQTEVLYSKAIEYAEIKSNEIVLDLYCGIGTIGIIASKYASKVIGIEVVEEAIEDAKENARINNVNNIEFYCMDAGDGANKLIEENLNPDVIIVDPPRKGLNKKAVEAVLKLSPSRIVYVSCNPSTLARDCKRFNDNGYSIDKVQPVDMFPLTVHVECVTLMSREK